MTEPPLADRSDRRRLLGIGLMGGALAAGLAACGDIGNQSGNAAGKQESESGEEGVSALEDLMREHGVLRRILIVYAETAPRLARGPAGIDAGALADAATLFRQFGEDYHERGAGSRPAKFGGSYHNLAVWGFALAEAARLDVDRCISAIEDEEGANSNR